MKESYYFAYGSNMNLDQMAYRCPELPVVENVKPGWIPPDLLWHREGCGVATILPEEGAGWKGCLEDHTGVRKKPGLL